MKTVPDHFTAEFSSFSRPPDRAIDEALLGRFGDDLRHVYGDLTRADVPDRLLELAETIDARRTRMTRDA